MSFCKLKLGRKSLMPLLFSLWMDSTTPWYALGAIVRRHASDAKLSDILRLTAQEMVQKLGKRRTPDKRSLELDKLKKAKKKGQIFNRVSQWRLKSLSLQKSPPPQTSPHQGHSLSWMHPKTNLQ